MEKVLMAEGSMSSDMRATMALESMPPLRKTPRGTSLMSRRRTECFSFSSRASCMEPMSCGISRASNRMDQ